MYYRGYAGEAASGPLVDYIIIPIFFFIKLSYAVDILFFICGAKKNV